MQALTFGLSTFMSLCIGLFPLFCNEFGGRLRAIPIASDRASPPPLAEVHGRVSTPLLEPGPHLLDLSALGYVGRIASVAGRREDGK